MSYQFEQSKQAFVEAQKVIPGGVNSPVRAFKAVGEAPVFVEHGEGAHITDIDGQTYVDMVCSWGPLILGHRHPKVVEAIRAALEHGTTFGMPTVLETKMAELICEMIPSVDMVRMVSSGTEATMSALRLARGYTKRDFIIKFEGCYHGHADHLLINAGSGAMTFGVPSSPGVPADVAKETLVAKYNDLESVKALFEQHPNDIAAVIVEPIPGNMGLIMPKEGFLEGLRALTTQYGAVLIFDEVISGFRASAGGAQKVFGITPDLTCLGKIIGGGLPVGAFGGKREIMECLSPSGPVYQAGTLSGNPLAMSAGYAALTVLKEEQPYDALAEKGKRLAEGLRACASKHGVPVTINQFGSLLTVFFTDRVVTCYADATTSNTEKFAKFFSVMLENGVHLPPSQFECWFLSTAHTDDDLEKTLVAADLAFAEVGKM
ncbi:MAG: glutamate-1-semialdehyde 2,1-aminomutase [Peptococcaceae bacterium]|nr:glutamate-1-semialdehyde 2,1-aminomutase [Peptococcaceae bacterium]